MNVILCTVQDIISKLAVGNMYGVTSKFEKCPYCFPDVEVDVHCPCSDIYSELKHSQQLCICLWPHFLAYFVETRLFYVTLSKHMLTEFISKHYTHLQLLRGSNL